MTDSNKPTQKDLWKAQILEFFHNYFIGISNLECSEENCPLVLNWDNIEEKNSKKGKCALYQVSKKENKFLVVDLVDNPVENDLGTIENIEIKFKSGNTKRIKPKDYVEPKEKDKKETFINKEEVVCFFNNSTHTPNLQDAETIYLDDLWDTKEKIKWDRKASKKKIINWVDQKPDTTDKSAKINEWEDNYVFYIANPDITNEIKNHEVYSTQNTKEREQLWADYKEEFSELRRVFGIRHLTSKKEDRQNNPEIELNEAQFIALERRKKRIREESIKEAENKKFCLGKHTLTYGTSAENREEKVLETKELQEETNDKEKLEQKITPNQEIFIEKN